ncbi:MAG TPA: universal stress protein [Opitutaceae bacterium]|nr:universal stress protein [Opitutaceae bacterium]
MKTILAAVDSSGMSAAVVAEAAELARATGGRVVLLTVVEPPVITSEYAPMIENIAEITAASEKAAERHLSHLRSRLRDEDIVGESIALSGAPVVEILAKATEHGADYIVMGSHGHTAFYDLLVGSTTHGVMRRASCPVVIVPPPKKEPKPRKSKK